MGAQRYAGGETAAVNDECASTALNSDKPAQWSEESAEIELTESKDVYATD
jgi:hypothetical protein